MSIHQNLYSHSNQEHCNLPSIVTNGIDWSQDFYGNAGIANCCEQDGEKYTMDDDQYEWWVAYGQGRAEIELRLEEVAQFDLLPDLIAPCQTVLEYVFSEPVDAEDEYATASEKLTELENMIAYRKDSQ